jgi:hypothetical protein
MLSWIRFKQSMTVRNLGDCKCEICKKEYNKETELNWIQTFSSFPFIFCRDCYGKVLELIENYVEKNALTK